MKSREIINELILGGSVSQFSCSAVSDSLWPHGLQHLSPPCPSLTLKPTQTHAHWVGDVIQPSQPLLSPFPPTFNLSQHQGLFKWVCSLYQVAQVLGVSASTSVLPMDYSGLISFRMDCLDLLAVKGTLKSLFQHHCSKGQFFGAQPSLWSNCHIHTWLLENHNFDCMDLWLGTDEISLVFLANSVTMCLPAASNT